MQLSAYVDDELPQNEAELLLRRLSQDVKLRQEVAEYLAIGRVMRGEVGVAGIDGIRNRVLAAIDDTAGTTDAVIENEPATRALRPLVGVAIAATVALAAIFGLQQTTGVDDVVLQDGNPLRVKVVPDYAPQQDLLRQYFLSHGETSSQLGANGMKSRLVTLRFSEELIDATVRELVEGVETNPEAIDVDGTTTQP
ncbi:MAG: sigma-E factor negative regulatory protein [Proteobacteria bacterium]|nr:sigma-E factor negative regulatory protein [Pseudomonadota bacterium]